MINDNLPVIYLNQGEFFISNQPCVVKTTLGSCVSLIIYDPLQKTGGICHALLPENPNKDAGDKKKFLYADSAIREMLNYFILNVIGKENLQIKLFGGASVVKPVVQKGHNPGEENIRSAFNTLKSFNIEPSVTDIGKDYGRKIFFYPHTGEILVKKIPIQTAIKHQILE